MIEATVGNSTAMACALAGFAFEALVPIACAAEVNSSLSSADMDDNLDGDAAGAFIAKLIVAVAVEVAAEAGGTRRALSNFSEDCEGATAAGAGEETDTAGIGTGEAVV